MKRSKNNAGRMALYLLLPVFLYYALFWMRPVYTAIIETFTNSAGSFSLENFARIWVDDKIREAFLNTVVFVVLSMVIQFFLSVGMALFLNRKSKLSNILLFITLIPMALPPTSVGILWKTGFYKMGWLNSLLCEIGLMSPEHLFDWMSVSGMKAVLFLVLVDTWTVLPSIVIIILAGLQGLNKEYEEAGWVFGASRFQTIKDVVIPIMKPTIMTAMILRFISSIQVWLLVVMIFGYNSIPFLVERIAYNVDVITFASNSSKDAYVLSVIVTVIVLVATGAYMKFDSKKEVK